MPRSGEASGAVPTMRGAVGAFGTSARRAKPTRGAPWPGLGGELECGEGTGQWAGVELRGEHRSGDAKGTSRFCQSRRARVEGAECGMSRRSMGLWTPLGPHWRTGSKSGWSRRPRGRAALGGCECRCRPRGGGWRRSGGRFGKSRAWRGARRAQRRARPSGSRSRAGDDSGVRRSTWYRDWTVSAKFLRWEHLPGPAQVRSRHGARPRRAPAVRSWAVQDPPPARCGRPAETVRSRYLGAHTEPVRARVHWPSGRVQVLKELESGRLHTHRRARRRLTRATGHTGGTDAPLRPSTP